MSISHITNAYKCWIRHELCCFLQACLTWSSFGLSQSPSWSVAVLLSHDCFCLRWHGILLPFLLLITQCICGVRGFAGYRLTIWVYIYIIGGIYKWTTFRTNQGWHIRKYVHLSSSYCMCIYLSVCPIHITLNREYTYTYIYIYVHTIYTYTYTHYIYG